MPPTGRAKKPTPYVAKASKVPPSGVASGKKSAPKTRAAAVPYRKKSYHSIAVPIKLARATCRIELVCPSPSPPSLCMFSSHVIRHRGTDPYDHSTPNDPIAHEPAQPGRPGVSGHEMVPGPKTPSNPPVP